MTEHAHRYDIYQFFGYQAAELSEKLRLPNDSMSMCWCFRIGKGPCRHMATTVCSCGRRVCPEHTV